MSDAVMASRSKRPLKVRLAIAPGADSDGRVQRWNEIRAMAVHAEAVGFDSLWFPDHLIVDIGSMLGADKAVRSGIWECWSILSALAAIRTKLLKILQRGS